MAVLLSEIKSEKKIFLGDFDPVKLVGHQSVSQIMIRHVKLAALLYDKILIPAAYLWQSDAIGGKIPYFQELIDAEILLPTIRAEDRDLRDRFQKRLNDTKQFANHPIIQRIPQLAGELTKKEQEKYIKDLYSQGKFVYLNGNSVSNELRMLWKKDLHGTIEFNIDTESLGMYFLECFGEDREDQVHALIELIRRGGEELPYISRTSLIEFIQEALENYSLNHQWNYRFINKRINWLYLLATAKASESDLYVNDMHMTNFSYANLELYLQTLKCMSITEKTLDSLSIADIIKIKGSNEYKSFLKKYDEIVGITKLQTEEEMQQVQQKIVYECRKERIRSILRRCRVNNDFLTGIATGLIANLICGTKINLTIAAVLGVECFMNRIRLINLLCPISDFKNYIQTEFSRQIAAN